MQGPGEATLSLPHVAYHEAGHAVAALEVGYPLASVSIVEDEETLGRLVTSPGWRERSLYTEPAERVVVEAAILVHLCGPAAVFQHTGDALADTQDHVRAAELTRALGHRQREVLDAYLHWQETRARVLVARRWPQIEALAHALLAHGTLSVGQIRGVARGGAQIPQTGQ